MWGSLGKFGIYPRTCLSRARTIAGRRSSTLNIQTTVSTHRPRSVRAAFVAMKEVETAFLGILAPSDELKVVIKALLLDSSLEESERGVQPNDKLLEDAPSMRVLAVVVHKEDLDDRQEGRYVTFVLCTRIPAAGGLCLILMDPLPS